MTEETHYDVALRDPRWKIFAGIIKHDADYTCEDCGTDHRKSPWEVAVHHVENDYKRQPWDWPLSNFRVLCHYCHEATHGLRPHDPTQRWLFTREELRTLSRDPHALFRPGSKLLH